MGNSSSRSDSSAFKPDATSPVSRPDRSTRLTNRLSLRRRTGSNGVEDEADVTGSYEWAEDTGQAQRGLDEPSTQSRPPTTKPKVTGVAQVPQETSRTTSNSQERPAVSRLPPAPPAGPSPPPSIRRATSKIHEDPARSAQLSGKIESISCLLREMYSLDLRIFGSQNARPEDQAERNKMIDEADSLFRTIKSTLDSWEAQSEVWTDDEREVIKSICKIAETHAPTRNQTRRA